MKIGGGTTAYAKGGNYEGYAFWHGSRGLLSACAIVTTAGDIAQGRQVLLEGNYQLALDYFWTGRPNRPQLHVRPSGTIRAGIKGDLDMISSRKIDWSQLIADGESLGIGIEQEEDDFRVQVLRS